MLVVAALIANRYHPDILVEALDKQDLQTVAAASGGRHSRLQLTSRTYCDCGGRGNS